MSAVQMDRAPSFVQSRTSDLHTTVHVTRHHSPIWPRRPGDHTFGRVGLIGRLLSGTKGAQNDASNKHEFQLPPTSLYQKQNQKTNTHAIRAPRSRRSCHERSHACADHHPQAHVLPCISFDTRDHPLHAHHMVGPSSTPFPLKAHAVLPLR